MRGIHPSVMAIYFSSQVYPACAGIHHAFLAAILRGYCLPAHARDPPPRALSPAIITRLPRMRGSTYGKTMFILEQKSTRMRGDPP